nr:MAG TPA: hypothetical protein [Microviridae sp.]
MFNALSSFMICLCYYFVLNFRCKGIKYSFTLYHKCTKIVRKGLRN